MHAPTAGTERDGLEAATHWTATYCGRVRKPHGPRTSASMPPIFIRHRFSLGGLARPQAVWSFMVRRTICTLLVGLGLASCAASEDESETARKQCLALRDHLIQLRLEAANDKIDVRAHRAALQQALGDKFVDQCRERPVKEIRCALDATDTASAVACSP